MSDLTLQDALDYFDKTGEMEPATVYSPEQLVILDAARKYANPDMAAAAREYARLRFGDSGFTREEAFDASLIVDAALGITEDE